MWILGAALAVPGLQAQNKLFVGVDTDNDPTTGCDIFVEDGSNAGQTSSGHEVFYSLDIVTVGGLTQVDRVVIHQCVGGSFTQLSVDDDPQCTFSANTGIVGSDVVDCLLPLQLPGPFVRVIFYSQSQTGSRDVVNQDGQTEAQEAVVALAGPLRVPALSEWALLLLAAALIGAGLLLLRRRPAGLAVLLLALCLPASERLQAFVDGAAKAMFSDPVGDTTGGDPASDITKASVSADSSGIWTAFDVLDLEAGTITIIKDAVPDDSQDFAFTGGLGAFSLDDDGGADSSFENSQSFQRSPGTYAVTETALAGFDLTSLNCMDSDAGGTASSGDPGSGTATIHLDPGETVTCTFTNTKRGTINIVKDTVPDDPQDFDFATTGGLSPSSFSLDDDADGTLSNTQTFTTVAPGSYTVTETAVAGFDLTISCMDPDGGTMTAGSTATIDLDPDESVTCTFTNTKRGTIEIVKNTVPDDPQDFDFTATGGLSPSSFSLDDDAEGTLSNARTFSDVPPGSYTVVESAAAGFDLTALDCVDSDGSGTASSGSPGTGTATINLDAGETVTCTFTNTKRGTIKIVKDTVPDDPQDFDFTATGGLSPSSFSLDDDAEGTLSNTQTFSDVMPGSYAVTETAAAGFLLTALDCADSDSGGTASSGDPGSRTATIHLDAGETATCTFTNSQCAVGIDIEKATNGQDADTAPGPEIDVGSAVTWTYVVTNTGAKALSNIQVSDDQGVAVSCPKTQLEPGEAMTCTGHDTAVAGQYANLGTVSADSCAGQIQDSDPSHYSSTTEGCTPGQWRSNTDFWPATGYTTSQSVASVFSAASAFPTEAAATLLEALSFSGGAGVEGAAQNLLRAGVAGLLSAAHPSVNYPVTTASLIAQVNAALASGDRDTMLTLAASLDANNNLGCPLIMP